MPARIHHLELYNFKSYVGNVVVGPFHDFTCIVGPNGSGKSNLMDALSFVLGSAQTATLRGKRMTDFISRQASKSECAVTIEMRTQSCPSNTLGEGGGGRGAAALSSFSTGTQDISNTTTSHSEVTRFSRRIDAGGATAVLINGRMATEKAFASALDALGISARVSTFLVFQHQVDQVSAMKGSALTQLLEHVSGSAELKEAYQSKRHELEAAQQALTQAAAEKRGATVMLSQVRMAKKEAAHYAELQQRYRREQHHSALVELFHVESELERQESELQRFQGKLAELQHRLLSEQAIRQQKRNYAEQHRAYLEKLRLSRSLTEELRVAHNAVHRLQAAQAHLLRKRDLQQAQLKACVQSAEQRSQELLRLEEQKQRQTELLRQFEAQGVQEDAEEAARQSACSETDRQTYRNLRTEADCETVMLRQQMETIRRERASHQEALRQCQLARERVEMQREDGARAVEAMTRQLRELAARREELTRTVTLLQNEIGKTQEMAEQAQSQARQRAEELAQVQEQLHELRFVKEDHRQATRMADALHALQQHFPGAIRGRLIDVCSIAHDHYRNAVTVGMGKHLDAVVVSTAEVAMGCVRYLKEQRWPAMTFLPLDTVQGRAVDDALRTALGAAAAAASASATSEARVTTCRPLIDCTQFDPAVEPAVRYALGQTLVCDTITEARLVAYGNRIKYSNSISSGAFAGVRFKVVTLDGTVLLKNGSVQGGLSAIQNRARRWDERRYEELRQRRDRLMQDGDAAGGGDEAAARRFAASQRDLTGRLQFTQQRVQMVQLEYDALERRTMRAKAEMQRMGQDAESAQTDRVAQYTHALRQCEEEWQRVSRAVLAVEERVFANWVPESSTNRDNTNTDARDVTQLRHQWLHGEEQHAQRLATRAKERQQRLLCIHQLDTSLAMERQRVQSGQSIATAQSVLATLESELAKYDAHLREANQHVQSLTSKQSAVRAALLPVRQKLDALEKAIHEAGRQAEMEMSRLGHARQGVSALQAACDTLRLRRLAVVRRCQMTNVELPLIVLPRSNVHSCAKGNVSTNTAVQADDETVGSSRTSRRVAHSSNQTMSELNVNRHDNNTSTSEVQSGNAVHDATQSKVGIDIRDAGESRADGTRYGDAAHRLVRSEPFTLLLLRPSSPAGEGSHEAHSDPTANTPEQQHEEERVCVDFSSLDDALRQAGRDRAALQSYQQRSDSVLQSLRVEMEALAPNVKAATRVRATEDRLDVSSTALERARERVRLAQHEFTRVRAERTRRFMRCYDTIVSCVDSVYQELTRSSTKALSASPSAMADVTTTTTTVEVHPVSGVHGSAYLTLEDNEEPYLGATAYHVTPPLKRYMPMELLSGGERTMATLALLFAIRTVSPTPFFVLDEVDAALDAGNVAKLAQYVRNNSRGCQFVVVSLKDQLYHMADMLVGVVKDRERQSSRVLTMDLRGYAY